MSITGGENLLIDRIMTAALIGLIGWNLLTTQALTVQVAKLEERIKIVDLLKQN